MRIIAGIYRGRVIQTLRGRCLRERAAELISIAHPEHQGELRAAAASCNCRLSLVISATFSPLKSVRMPICDFATLAWIAWTTSAFSNLRTLILL